MKAATKTTDLILIADKGGKIIGASPGGTASGQSIQVAIVPAPGQTIHHVQAQLDLGSLLENPYFMRRWLASHRIDPKKGLVQPKSTRSKHRAKLRKAKVSE